MIVQAIVTASVSGGNGSVNPASQTVDYGSNASVDLIPDTGYHVASITDNGTPVAIADPYVINNVTADHTVVVTYAIDTFTINASRWSARFDSPLGLGHSRLWIRSDLRYNTGFRV